MQTNCILVHLSRSVSISQFVFNIMLHSFHQGKRSSKGALFFCYLAFELSCYLHHFSHILGFLQSLHKCCSLKCAFTSMVKILTHFKAAGYVLFTLTMLLLSLQSHSFYYAMHCSAKCSLIIACLLSICLSVFDIDGS